MAIEKFLSSIFYTSVTLSLVFREIDNEWVCELTEENAHDMDVNCIRWNPKVYNLLLIPNKQLAEFH